MATTKKLTGKQPAFVEYYVRSWNATEAARLAGYSQKSYQGLRKMGSENLTKPHIKAAILSRLSTMAMETNEVLARIAEIARGFDVVDYAEQVPIYGVDADNVQYLKGHDLIVDFEKLQKDGYSHLIKSLKQTSGGLHVEWYSKFSALSKLLPDKIQIENERVIEVRITK